MAKSLEARFHAHMLAIYDHCSAFGFRPVLLRRLVILNGGANAARELIFKPGTTGLERLMDTQKTELSMEAAMASPEYQTLFTPLEIKEARRRLAGGTNQRSRGRLTAQARDV